MIPIADGHGFEADQHRVEFESPTRPKKGGATYRRRGGSKGQVLPEFFIGAHAAVEGWPLLSRDANRFKTYFATLDVIAP